MLELGRYREAIADYDRVIELEPENASGYYLRGCIYARLKDKKAALRDLDRALKLQPGSEEWLEMRRKIARS